MHGGVGAQGNHLVGSALDIGDFFRTGTPRPPVYGGHPLSVRIKGPLVDAGYPGFQPFLIKSMAFGQIKQCQLRGVSYPAALNHGVVAQGTGFQKKSMLFRIKLLLLHELSVHIAFPDRHPVLR